jgi:hypothetical protein
MPGRLIPGIGDRSGTAAFPAGVRGYAIPETGAVFN